MQNFVNKAAEYAGAADARPDTDPETWAVRVFSVLMTIGNHEGIDEVPGDLLAQLAAKAPDVVVMRGTMAVVETMSLASDMKSVGLTPDDLRDLS